MVTISENLDRVKQRITNAADSAGRPAESVTLVAVSKTKPAAMIREAYAAGQTTFGENYLQEATDKIRELADLPLSWHFIGPLQSNKTRIVAENFHWVHTLDRLKIARRLNDQRPAQLPPLQCCIQVNTSGEESKSGVTPEQLPELVSAISQLPRLQLRGLMSIPAPGIEASAAPDAPFLALAELLQNCNARYPDLALDSLSMGMSRDLEHAVGAGATLVRIGTDIFGQRA